MIMMRMLTMRSRSSRFFVVLLHLVGVSHHLPKQFHGIVGVHPCSIALERLELEKFGDGLDGWLRALYQQAAATAAEQAAVAVVTNAVGGAPPSKALNRQARQDIASQDLLTDPFWLQDTWDGKCLGPIGFSECGDATLWRIRQRRPVPEERRRQRRWMGVFEDTLTHDMDDEHRLRGFALQLIDPTDLLSPHNVTLLSPVGGNQHDGMERRECLLYNHRLRTVEMGSCTSPNSGSRGKLRGWSWKVNQKGILFLEKNRRKVNQQRLKRHEDPKTCLWRVNETEPKLSFCNAEPPSSDYYYRNQEARSNQHRVHLALIRYQVSGTPKDKDDSEQSKSPRRGRPDRRPEPSPPKQRLPSTVDIAHSHATTASFQHHHRPAELKSILPPKFKAKQQQEEKEKPRSFAMLKDTNPILFIGEAARLQLLADEDDDDEPSPPSSSEVMTNSNPVVPLRRIQMNPYIAASQNEIWIDPRTGLEYLTDLCTYLGHDRKESGRHTLIGVGQYVKARIIKIYGVAMYVSKRDVLADPAFVPFAGLTSEELRIRPDFYSHLRNMPSRTDQNAGLFDRTLFLKTNMQLSTETMRSSLQADWKMLTEEAKDLLISTSLKPRPVSDALLQKIMNPNNPSRCSCSQVAPPEYEADPSCCARGTELVFTWRKNGDVEIRLNGELMEIFPRPDIAKGIFYEYLRYDDPISPDFRDHAVDGFPFLLGPLAQIRGIALPSLPVARTLDNRGNVLTRAVDDLTDSISSQATDLLGFVQNGVEDMSNHAAKVAESAKEAIQIFVTEADRRRDLLWTHLMSASEHGMNVLSGRVRHPITWVSNVIGSSKHQNQASLVPTSVVVPIAPPPTRPLQPLQVPRGRAFRYPFSHWFGDGTPHVQAPDEIQPMVVHPTTNLSHKLFWGLVHLYLLLLLILSLPGYNTRTKFVLRRSKHETSSDCDETSESADDDDEDSSSEEEELEEDIPNYTPKKRDPQMCEIADGDWSGLVPKLDDKESVVPASSGEQRTKFPHSSSANKLLSRGRDALRRVAISRGRVVSSSDDESSSSSQRLLQPAVSNKGRMTKSLSYAL